uniref:(California timema) hypothetical protein n=1 Tax=Timema californicum TaxID=61474 RepID=A0A7R9IXV6_TIMCA|nr:unnamed protein product [Timema californicum]
MILLSLELDGHHICAATAIGDYWALTVAHCVTDVPADNLTLRAGTILRENNGTVHSIKNIITHHDFVEAELDNDIALIQVAEPFSGNQYVKYVVLPVQDEKVPIGTHAVVAGWGKTLRNLEAPSPVLRHASVNVVEIKNCEERISKPVVTINMICGERKGQQTFKFDLVPDKLLHRKALEGLGIKPGTSGSEAKNSDHCTTEAVKLGVNVFNIMTHSRKDLPLMRLCLRFLVERRLIWEIILSFYAIQTLGSTQCFGKVVEDNAFLTTQLFPYTDVKHSIVFSCLSGVAVEHIRTGQFCAATVMNNVWAISAAHCFIHISNPEVLQVRSGSLELNSGGIVHPFEKVISHPGFGTGKTLSDDIALIKSRFYGESSPILLDVTLDILDNDNCSKEPFFEKLEDFDFGISEGMICTETLGKDTTAGDSGGPLLLKKGKDSTLIGVVSFGEGSGDPGDPGVYTNVVYYKRWIYLETVSFPE